MNCKNCWAEIPGDSRSCPYCGASTERKPTSFLGAVFIGLFMGALGAVIGFFPMIVLRNYLTPFIDELEQGSLLRYLLVGYPLWIRMVVILPAAGAVVGILGALIGYQRKSPRIWLWGLLAGFLLNLFVSFWAM